MENIGKRIENFVDGIVGDKSGFEIGSYIKEEGLFDKLRKAFIERALEGEMSSHLGYEKHERSEVRNSRNGTTSKDVMSDQGKINISIPRDREGSFTPELIKKRHRRIDGLDDKILSLYAKGMSVSDIVVQLNELYGFEISESVISRVTDEILEEVKMWQERPLEALYPIVYFDCLMIKVRHEKRIINKAVYVALGVEVSGRKDILGLWIEESEGSKFWLSNLTELKNRGVNDILIACTDNLTGMSDAISAVFPNTDHQLCIVHQIRNSLKYVSYKDRKAICKDLKEIYSSTSEDGALDALGLFEEKWGLKYPQIPKSWRNNWENLIIFLSYPQEIRRIIYTTNAIESFNNQLRRVTKNKRVFPNDSAVLKTLYLTIRYITSKWHMPIRNWHEAMAFFIVKFDKRLTI